MGSRGYGEGCAELLRTRSGAQSLRQRRAAGGAVPIDPLIALPSRASRVPATCSPGAPLRLWAGRGRLPSPGNPTPRPRPRLREGHAPSSPAGPSGARRERGESARWLRPCAPRPPAWPRVPSAVRPPTRAAPGCSEPGEPQEAREREDRGGNPMARPVSRTLCGGLLRHGVPGSPRVPATRMAHAVAGAGPGSGGWRSHH